ncbi:holin [Traorella massiliensis]|uniref:holin n=1 Tax=Traorella massiliensis TaxID=1903263 RepID=UPI0008F89B51|nr:holin [Traorella massiliensis]
MKDKTYWIKWIKAAGIRAIKTMAQSAIGLIGTSVMISDVSWQVVASASLLAGIVSLLTSIAGLPEVQVENTELPL